MLLKKNIKVGKIKIKLFVIYLLSILLFPFNLSFSNDLDGKYTSIKILDKISSKNTLIKLKNSEEVKFKDLLIKSMKCRNSEFDDDPEIVAYIQVIDTTNKNKNNVFVFNGWMFSSSPSLAPFDHPVYDIWLIGCN